MNEITIVGIVGSQRQASSNRAALRLAQQLVPTGARLDLLELCGIPFFDRRCAHLPPAAVVGFRQRIDQADALLFATPECIHGVPGGLKSAIDWAAQPFSTAAWQGRPAAVISAASGSLVASRAQQHLQQLLERLEIPLVKSSVLIAGSAEAPFAADGRLAHEPARQFLRTLLAALVLQVRLNQADQRFSVKERA